MTELLKTEDLNRMPLGELRQLQAQIHDKILLMQREKREAALAAAREAAAAHGFELETLLPLQLTNPVPGTGKAKIARKTGKTGPANPPRYAKPGEPGVTWTGRGRRPSWIIDYLVAGGELKQIEI